MDQWTKLGPDLGAKMKRQFEFALERSISARAAKNNPRVAESTVGAVPDKDALAALLAEDDPEPPAHRLLDADTALGIGLGISEPVDDEVFEDAEHLVEVEVYAEEVERD